MEWIVNYLHENEINSGRELIKPKHKEFVEQLKRLTEFLPEDAPATFRLRCLQEGVKEVQICGHEECSNGVTIKSSLTKGLWYETFEFSGYCCRMHARTSKKTKEKKKETFRERYGVDSYMDSDEFRKKSKKSMIETHGRFSPNQKHIQTGSLSVLDNVEWLSEQYNNRSTQSIAEELGVHYSTVVNYLNKHNIQIKRSGISENEKQFALFVESLGLEVVLSDRKVLDGYELDIVIPSKSVAIEYDGVYWHSSKFKETRYHLNKTEAAQKKGYRLIHIFEDEWTYRQEQTKAKIRSILGMDDRKKLYARKCSIGDVDKNIAREFFDSNHIQGFASYTKAVGLYHDDELVACMTFRKRDDTEYELNRYATSKRVVGGFSKLLKHVVRELKSSGVERIISFADKRYSDGNLYIANGWTHEYDTPPDYQYVMGDRRYRKQNFRRSVLGKKLKNFDPEKTEKQNMIENGFYPIYDCGLMKFSMQL